MTFEDDEKWNTHIVVDAIMHLNCLCPACSKKFTADVACKEYGLGSYPCGGVLVAVDDEGKIDKETIRQAIKDTRDEWRKVGLNHEMALGAEKSIREIESRLGL